MMRIKTKGHSVGKKRRKRRLLFLLPDGLGEDQQGLVITKPCHTVL